MQGVERHTVAHTFLAVAVGWYRDLVAVVEAVEAGREHRKALEGRRGRRGAQAFGFSSEDTRHVLGQMPAPARRPA